MSVIWSGVTEEGAVVPVQVTTEGKVVADVGGSEGDYLELTGGNLTGDLTVNEQITLATDGTIVTVADATINSVNVGLGGGSVSTNTAVGVGALQLNTTGGSNTAVGNLALTSNTEGNYNTVVGLNALSQSTTGDQNTVVGNGALLFNTEGNYNTAIGRFAGLYLQGSSNTVLGAYQGTTADAALSDTVIIAAGATERLRIDSTGSLLFGGTLPSAPNIELNANGSATFTGDVVIGSRGEKWLIRESNGVAMLVQQNLRGEIQPEIQPEMEDIRDLPNELDLIESALSEVMEKLRMTPPAGWPVWDGSDNA